jgi:hypothetical protein
MHDLIDQLKPVPGEFLIDKPGKGAYRKISPVFANFWPQGHSIRPSFIRSLSTVLYRTLLLSA